jgi:hypothetical protein
MAGPSGVNSADAVLQTLAWSYRGHSTVWPASAQDTLVSGCGDRPHSRTEAGPSARTRPPGCYA